MRIRRRDQGRQPAEKLHRLEVERRDTGDLPEGLTEAMLAELCAKLGKKSKRSPSELADQVVGTDEGGTWGRRTYLSNAAIAILIDRGLWPDKLIPEVLREAVLGWAFMRPETLLGS